MKAVCWRAAGERNSFRTSARDAAPSGRFAPFRFARAIQLGQYFLTRLAQMSFKGKATIRGKGFAIGIEVEDETYASEVSDSCRENGLLVSAEDDVLMLFPALTITRQTAERGLDIFEKSLQPGMKSAAARRSSR